jgi:hypothetical protein
MTVILRLRKLSVIGSFAVKQMFQNVKPLGGGISDRLENNDHRRVIVMIGDVFQMGIPA